MASPHGTSTPTKPPLKILMLHGYTQNGQLFRSKTRALEKHLIKAFPHRTIVMSYPTAPIQLFKSDIPNWDDPNGTASFENKDPGGEEAPDCWGWWRRKGEKEPYTYGGMEEGFARCAEVLKSEGPFDGVIGFSQGGALAGMLASTLEMGRREAFEAAQAKGGMRYPESLEEDTGYVTDVIHQPFKFAVSYSGFGATNHPLYQAFYEPKIKTPMMHYLGTMDTVVEGKRSLRLVESCEDGHRADRVVRHPGGHFLPSSQKTVVAPLIAFIKETADGGGSAVERKEEDVEDMDVPF